MLVWYIKKQCTKGQEEYLEKADYLFNYFEKNNILIVIPSLVVGELLGNIEDEDEREGYFDYISSNFEIAQHDIVSARKFTELRLKLSKTNAKSYATENNIPKCLMINDYNICAVAISSGCDAVFSHNLKDFEHFADHQILIYNLDYVDVLKAEEEKNEKFHSKKSKDPAQTSFFDQTNDNDNDDEYEGIEVIP